MEKLHFGFESHYELRSIISPFALFSFSCVRRGFETHRPLSETYKQVRKRCVS